MFSIHRLYLRILFIISLKMGGRETERRIIIPSSYLMATAAAKKRSGGDGAEEERWTRRCRAEEAQVTDDEVEEFFAILQRMREAARFFVATRGGAAGREGVGGEAKGERVTQTARRWQPAFEREDFEESGAVENAAPRGMDAAVSEEEVEAVVESGIPRESLDLNAVPVTEE